jgi:methyl-accepting chemotaxis protein
MTAENWILLVQVVGGLMGVGGVGAVVRAFLRRRPARVEAHVQLNAATLEWAKKLEASADRAWARANEAEAKAEQANERAEEADQRADKAEQTARRAQAQIEELARYMSSVLRLIHDPGMTMDRLRESVGEGPPHIS